MLVEGPKGDTHSHVPCRWHMPIIELFWFILCHLIVLLVLNIVNISNYNQGVSLKVDKMLMHFLCYCLSWIFISFIVPLHLFASHILTEGLPLSVSFWTKKGLSCFTITKIVLSNGLQFLVHLLFSETQISIKIS